MNIDLDKVAKVLTGELPKTTSVGWGAKPDRGGFTRYFVAFKNDGEVVRAKDGSVKLNQRDYNKDHSADIPAAEEAE